MSDYIKREDAIVGLEKGKTMSALKEMMTQEDAMNMSNEQAVQILIPMRNMMCDQNGCPISDAVFALDKAIESLSVDVVPIRHGHWIYDGFDIICSECGTAFNDEVCYMMRSDVSYHEPKHCLWCGARMDGEK